MLGWMTSMFGGFEAALLLKRGLEARQKLVEKLKEYVAMMEKRFGRLTLEAQEPHQGPKA